MIEIAFPDFWPERLAWLVALVTMVTGFSAMITPRRMMRVVGLGGASGTSNGVSEFRSSVGGALGGLGLACLLMAQPFTYFALGLMFFFASVGRIVSFFADGTFNKHCIFFLVVESLGAYFPLQFVYSAFFPA